MQNDMKLESSIRRSDRFLVQVGLSKIAGRSCLQIQRLQMDEWHNDRIRLENLEV